MIDRLIIYGVLVALICLSGGAGFLAGKREGKNACAAEHLAKTVEGAREDTAAKAEWDQAAVQVAIDNAGIEAANGILARSLEAGGPDCIVSGKWLRGLATLK